MLASTTRRMRRSEAQRKLALEEMLIAEGSDWNWWYGPEHHSANDRDFDELYRKHLVECLSRAGSASAGGSDTPIIGGGSAAYLHSADRVYSPANHGLDKVRYFEWMGAAVYTADQRTGAMHGKQFLLDSVYAGIDSSHVYGRLDFAGKVPEEDFELVVNVESWASGEPRPRRALRVEASVHERKLKRWKIENGSEERVMASSSEPDEHVKLALLRNFEFKLPLAWLLATPSAASAERTAERKAAALPAAATSKLRLRFSLWQNRLPVDSLPLEGWIELQVLSEGDLIFGA